MARRERDLRGIAAIILAVGIFVTLIIADIGAAINPDRTVSTEEVATVSTVLGAAVGAIAGYLSSGGRPRNGGDKREPDKPEITGADNQEEKDS